MVDFIKNYKFIISFTVCVCLMLLFSFILIYISYARRDPERLKKKWGEINLSFVKYYFYFSKANSYRLVFSFFTFLNYFIKMLSMLLTLFVVYTIVKEKLNIAFSLVSAFCDALSLLFPFQKYIDTFSECTIIMEKAILKATLMTKEAKVNKHLNKAYIKCEKIIHIKQKL